MVFLVDQNVKSQKDQNIKMFIDKGDFQRSDLL